jgi:glycosyltransferase involved in cell wall biosynthesis
LNVASGDYICIADHDDSWENQRLASLLPYLEKAPIVTSGYTLVDEVKNKNIVRKNSSDSSHLFFSKNETFLKKLTKSLSGQNTYLGSIIFKKELKHILFEEHFGMVDFDWILRMLHQQESIEVCDSLYTRYVTDQNLSLNEAYRVKDFYYSLMHIESYENLYPREVSLAYRKIHGSRARYYYLMGNMKKARFYFMRSRWDLVTLLYYLTTFAGSGFVKKRFNVFG